MTLQQRISALITAVGADIKALYTAIGSLASLTTTNKTSLVLATNELVTKIGNLTTLTTTEKSNLVGAINEIAASISGFATINDTAASGTTTYSSTKIDSQIATAITALLNGADASNDTLKELADRITAAVAADAGAVSAIAVQSFTAPQKAQARTNIDAYGSVELGNPDTDLAALYATAKA